MTLKKICVVTGTRAEYGLLHYLLKDINNDSEFDLQLIVTGMHLSPEFGNTYQEIEKDGFNIDEKIDISLSSDCEVAIAKSIGIGVSRFAEVFDREKPDLLILLGDRYEIFSSAIAAMVSRVPIAHIHGGETTEGVIDEAIRHSITKMSFIHFTATEEYRNRVIQLGEDPSRVFNVGGLGVDNISKIELLSREQLEDAIGFNLGKKNILVTYHPVTLEENTSESQFEELLSALDELSDTKIIFTKSNSDSGGRIVNQMIDEYTSKRRNTIAFDSMGYQNYLSLMQYVDIVMGNSSSGLLEAPTFKIATIDIGDRQKGRIKAKSVISCLPLKSSIKEAIVQALSVEFRFSLKAVTNPYGSGGASKQIFEIIKKLDCSKMLKKSFLDLNFDK